MHPVTNLARRTYRAQLDRHIRAVICLAFMLLVGTQAKAQLSGNYTIGGSSASYSTIDAAISALNSSGVSGAVTFLINSGTYTCPSSGWTLGSVTGMSASNTVTFKPASGATVVLTGNTSYNSFPNGNGVFTIAGGKYFVLDGSNASGGTSKDMTIRQTDVSYGSAIILKNDADKNIIKNCIVQSTAQYTTTTYGGGSCILIWGTNTTSGNDSNLIQNNTLGDPNGTYRCLNGVYIYPGSTSAQSYSSDGNQIIGNDIINLGSSYSSPSYTAYGIYHYYAAARGTVIRGNQIHNTSISSGCYAMYGMYIYDGQNTSTASQNVVIDGNRIYSMLVNMGNGYGYNYPFYIYQQYSGNTTTFTNNMVSVTQDGPMYVFGYITTSTTTSVTNMYNNSFYVGGVGSSSYYVYLIYKSSTGALNFKNNIVYVTRTGSTGTNYALMYNNTTGLVSDYNQINANPASNYYTGYYSGARTTLANFQAASSTLDPNSRGGIPGFVNQDAGDLHISTTVRTPVADAGTPVGVTVDYDNSTRSSTTPDIGADEGSFLPLLANDVMAQQVTYPTLPPFNIVRAGATFNPRGVVFNTGTSTASSVTARFRIWNNSNGSLAYNDQQTISSLAALNSQAVTFNTTGSVSGSTLLAPGTYTTELRVEYGSDQDTSNNAIYSTIVVKNPLCGTYTINPSAPASSSNYQSFTSAIADLNGVGVTCAVTFLVSGGTYNATSEIFPITLGAPSSITATNNVTFKPASGAQVILTGNASDGIINIDQGDYYTFDGSNTAGGTTRNWTVINEGSGPAVRLTNGANSNTIKNMSLRAANTASSPSSSSNAGVICMLASNTSYSGNSNNTISNNLVGDTTGTIRSSIGIYTYGSTSSSSSYYSTNNLIENNDVVNFGAGTYGYGITNSYYGVQVKVLNNRIYTTTTNNTSSVQYMYGIYDYYRLYGTGTSDTIAYNKVWNLQSAYSSLYQYGLYVYYPQYYSGTGITYAIHDNLLSIRGGYYHYGLYFYYTYMNIQLAHNTIDMSGASSGGYFYWYYNYGNSSFKNNIYNHPEGGYLFYEYYNYGTITYNRNIYSKGSSTTFAYVYNASTSSTYSDFSAWRSGTGSDANSTHMASIPFMNEANGDYHINPQPVFFGESAGEALGVTKDFDGDTRNLQNPDIGADEGNFNGGGIRVTSPNGGEQLTTGYLLPVMFTTNRSMAVRVELSTNNGATWINMGTVSPTNSGSNTFTITLPDTVTNQGRIRVMSQVNQWEGDTSDASFNLVRPILGVVTPNGGERWVASDTNAIRWTSQFVPPTSKVQLDYSTDAGTTWLPIAQDLASQNLPATNTYNWIIPNTPSDQALVRVKVQGGNTTDRSDAVFTIIRTPNVQLVTPNGGEKYFVGEKRSISWTSVTTDNIKLEYSSNGGTTWNLIVGRIPAYIGSYDWTVPDASTANALVRITNVERPRFGDASDGVFSILKGDLTVLSPNGGETYELNQPVTVTWSSQNVTNVRVDYSANNGLTWETVAASVAGSAGNYTFTPPQIPTKVAVVRVVDASREQVQDRSDRPFEILESKSITVLAPGEGDQLQRGTGTTIMWSAPRVTSVTISYSSNNGQTWTTVASNVNAALGSYSWTTPNTLTTQGRIRLQEVGGSTTGESGRFSIVDQAVSMVRVIRPNGGEKYTSGDPVMIQWTASSDLLKVALSYSSDGGTTWTLISNSVSASVGQYSWTAPAVAGTQYRVKVDGGSANDASDADFTVEAKLVPRITVVSPNGGENLTVGTTSTIRWTSQDVSGMAMISYSIDGGAWIEIATIAAVDQSYDWLVPDMVSDQALVKVEAVDGSASDVSNGTFAISHKVIEPIIVTAPNTGTEVWVEGEKRQITWESPADITQVDLAYSTDGGQSWKPIASSASVSGPNSYEWTVPQVVPASTNSLVRVRATADTTRYDVSDNPFTLQYSLSSVAVAGERGGGLQLGGVYPNPFGERTQLHWYQSVGGEVNIRIYDGTGRQVGSYGGVRYESGDHVQEISAGELTNGVYYYEVQSGGVSARGVMVVLR